MPKEPAHILRMRGTEQEESLSSSIPFSVILLMRAAGQKHQPLKSAALLCCLTSSWVQERWHYWTTNGLLRPFSSYSQETNAFIVKYQRKSKCSWENRRSEVVYKSQQTLQNHHRGKGSNPWMQNRLCVWWTMELPSTAHCPVYWGPTILCWQIRLVTKGFSRNASEKTDDISHSTACRH